MSLPATMRVVSTDEASQGPFVVINSADFDPAVHTPYGQAPQDNAAESTDKAPAAPRARRTPKEG